MVDPESCSNDGLASKQYRRPGKCDARIYISIVRLAKTGADSAKACGSASRKIKWIRAAQHFMEYAEETVTRSQVQGEIWAQLQFVLKVSEVLRLAQTIDR